MAAGLTINLALGILYSWSVFKDSILKSIEQGGEDAFHWDKSSLNNPYAVCVLAGLSLLLKKDGSKTTVELISISSKL
ncbi:hypothetical protein [Riemerella columbina]|uniref:hypothetical protein n=1 Tax=Riemerella columbina TaxID=103810 RepID=UPI00036069C9|nr:hypothetical protein [Riemerella columbina]